MKAKYGEFGPGEKPTKNEATTRRDMLQEVQDIDGLPWEVRWRKNAIPSSEELLQDMRDRFDLYIQDPIEREVDWYLHWKDRLYEMNPDRLLWPQGYTDYLDNYDASGRRRVLPSAQKWTDTSWRYLADTQYKDRMWLVEGEARKGAHAQLQSTEDMMRDEAKRQQEAAEMVLGLQSGVIDLDDDQVYQSLSGTADPKVVAETKHRLNTYSVEQNLLTEQQKASRPVDPVSGLLKSSIDTKPLPSGLTLEQGAAIVARDNLQRHMISQAGETSTRDGIEQTLGAMRAIKDSSDAAGGVPGSYALASSGVENAKRRLQLYEQQQQQQLIGGDKSEIALPTSNTSNVVNVISAFEASAHHHQKKKSADPPKKEGTMSSSGYITVPSRPDGSDPLMAREMYPEVPVAVNSNDAAAAQPHGRSSHNLNGDVTPSMPDWYVKQAVNTESLIQSYGLVNDPLEMQAVDARYQSKDDANRASPEATFSDEGSDGDWVADVKGEAFFPNAFDEVKNIKSTLTPELTRDFTPLPKYHEVPKTPEGDEIVVASPTAVVEAVGIDGKPLKRSEILRRERSLRNVQKAKKRAAVNNSNVGAAFDGEMMLPTLPWETDAVLDPNRGLANAEHGDLVLPIDRPSLEATWKAYRESFRLSVTNLSNKKTSHTEKQIVDIISEMAPKFRRGDVGHHPDIPEPQLEVIKITYEAHVKEFLAEYLKTNKSRPTEVKVYKQEAEQLLRQATAKAKLLGKGFVNFMEEMTIAEMESVRQSPIQKYAIILKEPKLDAILQPFKRWIEHQNAEFTDMVFANDAHMEQNLDALKKSLNDARFQAPLAVEGVSEALRAAAIDAMHHWCLGGLYRRAALFLMDEFIRHGELRFRSKAEYYFENATESYQVGYSQGHLFITMPVPGCETPYDFADSDFIGGENALVEELQGNFTRADELWINGTRKRLYPVVDETETMWYNERRGRFTNAIDISDRTLEGLNKRTHPSIHPFPDRARPFLEGAPLTQETAEHLWMRYMGEVYREHGLFMGRVGRFATARDYMEKSIGFLQLAIREAKEKLPPSWKAVLLTQAKYLGCLAEHSAVEDPSLLVRNVDELMTKLYNVFDDTREQAKTATAPTSSRSMMLHWMDGEYDLPARVALAQRIMPILADLVTQRAVQSGAKPPTNDELMRALAKRAQLGGSYEMHHEWFAATDAAAEEVVRKRILGWRAREVAGSDPYLYLTHLYFYLRVHPKSATQVDEYWSMYEPVYKHIHTRAAAASRSRGSQMINDALRRVCHILLPGEKRHHDILLQELTTLRETLTHMVPKVELDRTIAALRAHMNNPASPPYVFGSSFLNAAAIKGDALKKNQSLRVSLASKEYAETLKKIADAKSINEGNHFPQSRLIGSD